MRVIRIFDVILQYIFILLFAGSLVAGVFRWQWFIAAGAALLCYLIWGMWKLRCPWCRGPVELNELLLGRRRTCHCPACGHEITVVVKLGKLTPKPEPDFERIRVEAAARARASGVPAEPVGTNEPEEPEDVDSPEGADVPEMTVRRNASLEEAVAAILGPDMEDTGTGPVENTNEKEHTK